MKILTKEQILLLHSQLIEGFGGSSDIRDNALLDSAINTPSKHMTAKNYIRLYWIKPRACALVL